MGMYDPNESFQLLAVFDLDVRGIAPIMNLKTYDDRIMKCGKWIDNFDSTNKLGYECVPTLTVTYTFDSVEDKSINQHIFSFIVTQPEKYFKTRKLDDMDIDLLSNNISVLLSIYQEDDKDEYAADLLDLFKNQTSYDYSVIESHVHLEVENGDIIPVFSPQPYWKEIQGIVYD